MADVAEFDIETLADIGDPSLMTPEEQAQFATIGDQGLLQQEQRDHFQENLAENIDENDLNRISNDVIEWFDRDEESRREWRERERMGIRLLGVIDDVGGGAPFDNASILTHPVLMEALLQFQSQAIQEFFPPEGPAKMIAAPGRFDPELELAAKRVRDFINYQYTELMPGAFESDDQMMMRLPLSGSCFKKIFFDELEDMVMSELVEPSYFVAPYTASSLRRAERYTDKILMTDHELMQRQEAGEYLDFEVISGRDEELQSDSREVVEAIEEAEGRESTSENEDDRRVILQQHVHYKLPGSNDKLKSPYIITVDMRGESHGRVLSIRRNWNPDDELRRKIVHFIHYKFIPGFGFYGYGLLHIMGSLAEAATGNLRALQDSAAFANLQGGITSNRTFMKGKKRVLGPGEWEIVDVVSEDIRKDFLPWPYKEPSPTMFNLLQYLDETGRRIGNVTNITAGEQNPRGAPVGTVLALIEQANIRPTAIHKRLFKARQLELRRVIELDAMYLPDEYPYPLPDGTESTVFAQDFDEIAMQNLILPVADPQVISGQQRIAQSQAMQELAQSNPDLFDRRAAIERLLQALRIPQYESMMIQPQETPRANPVEENMRVRQQQPVAAYPDQDHQAHIIVHQAWLGTLPEGKESEELRAAITAHIAEHQALLYQMQMQQATGMQIPIGQELPPEMENQIAQQAAQAAQLMPKPLTPEEADIERKDMEALAKIQRENALAQAEMDRDDEKATTDMLIRVQQEEARLIEEFAEDNAREVSPDAAI